MNCIGISFQERLVQVVACGIPASGMFRGVHVGSRCGVKTSEFWLVKVGCRISFSGSFSLINVDSGWGISVSGSFGLPLQIVDLGFPSSDIIWCGNLGRSLL